TVAPEARTPRPEPLVPDAPAKEVVSESVQTTRAPSLWARLGPHGWRHVLLTILLLIGFLPWVVESQPLSIGAGIAIIATFMFLTIGTDPSKLVMVVYGSCMLAALPILPNAFDLWEVDDEGIPAIQTNPLPYQMP